MKTEMNLDDTFRETLERYDLDKNIYIKLRGTKVVECTFNKQWLCLLGITKPKKKYIYVSVIDKEDDIEYIINFFRDLPGDRFKVVYT